MTGSNRAAILSKVHKVLKKHYKPAVPPAERSVLEHLLYACCLENARVEAADEAFAKLKELFFDWNEVRVTTTTELAEVMTSIPDAAAAATRIKKSLQSVFEAICNEYAVAPESARQDLIELIEQLAAADLVQVA